jgi:hypothetical protein
MAVSFEHLFIAAHDFDAIFASYLKEYEQVDRYHPQRGDRHEPKMGNGRTDHRRNGLLTIKPVNEIPHLVFYTVEQRDYIVNAFSAKHPRGHSVCHKASLASCKPLQEAITP